MRSRTASRARCTRSPARAANASTRALPGCAHDVARGAHVVLQQPRLEIEAARIDVAVRALQAHAQRPALAGVQRRHDRIVVVASMPCEPGERDARAEPVPRAARTSLHGKREAVPRSLVAGRSSMTPVTRRPRLPTRQASASAMRALRAPRGVGRRRAPAARRSRAAERAGMRHPTNAPTTTRMHGACGGTTTKPAGGRRRRQREQG